MSGWATIDAGGRVCSVSAKHHDGALPIQRKPPPRRPGYQVIQRPRAEWLVSDGQVAVTYTVKPIDIERNKSRLQAAANEQYAHEVQAPVAFLGTLFHPLTINGLWLHRHRDRVPLQDHAGAWHWLTQEQCEELAQVIESALYQAAATACDIAGRTPKTT